MTEYIETKKNRDGVSSPSSLSRVPNVMLIGERYVLCCL